MNWRPFRKAFAGADEEELDQLVARAASNQTREGAAVTRLSPH